MRAAAKRAARSPRSNSGPNGSVIYAVNVSRQSLL